MIRGFVGDSDSCFTGGDRVGVAHGRGLNLRLVHVVDLQLFGNLDGLALRGRIVGCEGGSANLTVRQGRSAHCSLAAALGLTAVPGLSAFREYRCAHRHHHDNRQRQSHDLLQHFLSPFLVPQDVSFQFRSTAFPMLFVFRRCPLLPSGRKESVRRSGFHPPFSSGLPPWFRGEVPFDTCILSVSSYALRYMRKRKKLF